MQILNSVRDKFLVSKPKDVIINFFCYVNDDNANSACKEFFNKGCGGVENQLFIIDPQEQMKNKEPITDTNVEFIHKCVCSYVEGELEMAKVD